MNTCIQYVCMYVYIHIHTHAHAHARTQTHRHTDTQTRTHNSFLTRRNDMINSPTPSCTCMLQTCSLQQYVGAYTKNHCIRRSMTHTYTLEAIVASRRCCLRMGSKFLSSRSAVSGYTPVCKATRHHPCPSAQPYQRYNRHEATCDHHHSCCWHIRNHDELMKTIMAQLNAYQIKVRMHQE